MTDSLINILNGLKSIMISRNILITDYFLVGGIGASFINAALLTFICLFLIQITKTKITGSGIAAIFSVSGFALFGKNLVNVWFMFLGVIIYTLIKREKISDHLYSAFFGMAMAPLTSEFIFSKWLPLETGMILSITVGIFTGLIIVPLSRYFYRFHQGYCLYNTGLTAGLITTIIISIMRSYGYSLTPHLLVSNGDNLLIGSFLLILFVLMIIVGIVTDNTALRNYPQLFKETGKLMSDYLPKYGFSITMINMGFTGLLSLGYVLLVGGKLNGPVTGAILVVIGFSAMGKHPKNVFPILLGVGIGAVTKIWNINDTSIILAALFGTSLAPLAGEFGFFVGLVASYIHLSVTVNVVSLHGGLNLYNNGFASGLVVAFLYPIIRTFSRRLNK